MNALEKIFSQIDLSAKKEVERLRTEHEAECEKVISKYESMLSNELIRLEKKIKSFRRKLRLKVDAENLIFKNKAILQTKQDVVSEVVELAFEAIVNKNIYENQYFSFMERLMEKNLPSSGIVCSLIYGSSDFDRFVENLRFRPSEFLKIEKSDKFDYGARIICSDFEVDLSLKSLLFGWCDGCRPKILKVLQLGEFDN